ncbi:hypothetical protein GGI12_000959 [Dipsacomyces acuminosporus]|nr:hypothetical protein GGI12_000959 [Dipsacomyces acuminosporus]
MRSSATFSLLLITCLSSVAIGAPVFDQANAAGTEPASQASNAQAFGVNEPAEDSFVAAAASEAVAPEDPADAASPGPGPLPQHETVQPGRASQQPQFMPLMAGRFPIEGHMRQSGITQGSFVARSNPIERPNPGDAFPESGNAEPKKLSRRYYPYANGYYYYYNPYAASYYSPYAANYYYPYATTGYSYPNNGGYYYYSSLQNLNLRREPRA